MRSSGLPIHHIFNIPLKNFRESVYIAFIGDIHFGAPGHVDGSFDKFCKMLAAMENTYFVLTGDSLDFASRKERQQLVNNPSIHETTRDRLNDMAVDLADDLVHKLRFMKGRLIGAVDGNHNYPLYIDGAELSTEAYIAHKLGGKFLGELGFITLRFKREKSNKTFTKVAVVHHGKGGGRTPGGSLNAVNRLRNGFDADIYVMGHDHQLLGAKQSRVYPGKVEGEIKERVQVFLRSGSYLAGYQHNIPSYIVSGLYPPATLGSAMVEFQPWRTKAGGTERVGANMLVRI